MSSQNAYIKIAKTTDIPLGAMKKITIETTDVLIIHTNEGFYAINSLCTHMKGDLSDGKLDGHLITCPRHGAQFDITTGAAIRGPKIAFLKLTTSPIKTYPLKVKDQDILIQKT